MAAIVRIKRRRDEDHADALMFFCKKKKKDEISNQEKESFKRKFKYAATVKSEKDSITKPVRKVIQQIKLYKTNPEYISSRNQPRENRKEEKAKYKIVKQKKTDAFDKLDLSHPSNHKDDSCRFHFFELERIYPLFEFTNKTEEVECNGVKLIREKLTTGQKRFEEIKEAEEMEREDDLENSNYVYDIYYMNDYNFDYNLLTNIQSVEAFSENFDFMQLPEDDEVFCEDSEEDENNENHWRNDYPDEYNCFYESDEDEEKNDYFDRDKNDFDEDMNEDFVSACGAFKIENDVMETNNGNHQNVEVFPVNKFHKFYKNKFLK